jgi:hypothetical protein
MGQLVAASRLTVTLLRAYCLGVIGFQGVLLLLQQDRKYVGVNFLAYLLHLDIVV